VIVEDTGIRYAQNLSIRSMENDGLTHSKRGANLNMSAVATREQYNENVRFARLPWPIRAVGAVLDFILRRPSL
jgi:hypothetical protein